MASSITPADRHVPSTYEGELESNYFCRHWNPKRLKYCRARAGQGTDHLGVGRCKNAGGATPVKHRRYSKIKSHGLGKLIEKHQADPDPLNLLPELATARALLEDYLDRKGGEGKPEDLLDGVSGHLEAISRIVKRIEDIRAQDAISRPELIRVMAEMGRNAEHRLQQLARRVVELVPPAQAAHLEDLFGEAREAIAEDWNRIQVA